MRIKTAGRHTKEGFKNLFRNGWMTVASISAVAVTLFILGIAIVLSLNVQNVSLNIQDQLQINAYVQTNFPEKGIPLLETNLESLPGVRSVSFVSKAQALKQMEKILQSNADLINGLGNPLPDEFILQARDPNQTATVAKEVQLTPGIAKVEYGQGVLSKILEVTTIMRDSAIVFIIALLVMGIFLIANTIKITIFTRRREIEIMKLVGATNGFIRGPFFVEGTLMGVIGALMPSWLLYEIYQWLTRNVPLFPPFSLLPSSEVFGKVVIVLLLCGVFVGVWGSIVSIRRFLRA